MMKIGSNFGIGMDVWNCRAAGLKAVSQWSLEPVGESGLGVAANPKLLPPVFGEHAGQNVASSTPPESGDSLGGCAMDIIYHRVAGLDLHKKTVFAEVRCVNHQGKLETDLRTFGTMTRDLLQLLDWLTEHGVTHVAMEATGVLWKPVWNILDGHFELLLVNPRELKQVPGRKSDVKDCQWIARLLQHGLLRSSFVPCRPQRELRDLTRHRAQLQGERTRVANRIHKLLEDANIKLGAVASDILGVSGREMLEQLADGEHDPMKLARLARGRMKRKIPQLQLALEGAFQDHHRFMLRQLLTHLEHLDQQVAQFSARIEELLDPFVDQELEKVLLAIPGIDRLTIENVVAEIGVDMNQFPTGDHLSSWAGMCPGNEESAGKRKRRRTTQGNRWLKRALAEAAWAASHTSDSYLHAQYHRLAGRRGKKRALIAVGHSLLIILYHVIKYRVDYRDLGADYFLQLEPERTKRYLVKRLEQLGYEVQLEPKHAA
jgi:transposase